MMQHNLEAAFCGLLHARDDAALRHGADPALFVCGGSMKAALAGAIALLPCVLAHLSPPSCPAPYHYYDLLHCEGCKEPKRNGTHNACCNSTSHYVRKLPNPEGTCYCEYGNACDQCCGTACCSATEVCCADACHAPTTGSCHGDKWVHWPPPPSSPPPSPPPAPPSPPAPPFSPPPPLPPPSKVPMYVGISVGAVACLVAAVVAAAWCSTRAARRRQAEETRIARERTRQALAGLAARIEATPPGAQPEIIACAYEPPEPPARLGGAGSKAPNGQGRSQAEGTCLTAPLLASDAAQLISTPQLAGHEANPQAAAVGVAVPQPGPTTQDI